MKGTKFLPSLLFVGILSVLLPLLSACGPGKDRVRFEGKLENISQAEFYAYSDAGEIDGIDTIRIEDGRFTYERMLTRPVLLTLLYPNFTRTYVILEPGKTIRMKGDAAKIGEATITGSEENQLLTDFRLANLSGPEAKRRLAASQFIRDHASTLAAVAVFKRHFAGIKNPDPAQALAMLDVLHQAQPQNRSVIDLEANFRPFLLNTVGSQMQAFEAQTLDGAHISSTTFEGKGLIVLTCATWRPKSFSLLRSVRRLLQENELEGWECLIVSLDSDVKACRERLEADSISYPVVCDGMSFDSPLVNKLSLTRVPTCMVVDKSGKILARDVTDQSELLKYLKQ